MAKSQIVAFRATQLEVSEIDKLSKSLSLNTSDTLRKLLFESTKASEPFTVECGVRSTIAAMRNAKPNDRSDLDRHIQIAITDMEKILAWWKYVNND